MTDVSIAHAMKSVDRANYVVPGSGDPYQDSPQPIGYGATISAPHMHAHCLEVLRDWLKPGARRGLSSTHTNHLLQKIIRAPTCFHRPPVVDASRPQNLSSAAVSYDEKNEQRKKMNSH